MGDFDFTVRGSYGNGVSLTAGSFPADYGDTIQESTVEYQWFVDGRLIPGANGSIYVINNDPVLRRYQVTASYVNSAGERKTKTSKTNQAMCGITALSFPDLALINVLGPSRLNTFVYGNNLSAKSTLGEVLSGATRNLIIVNQTFQSNITDLVVTQALNGDSLIDSSSLRIYGSFGDSLVAFDVSDFTVSTPAYRAITNDAGIYLSLTSPSSISELLLTHSDLMHSGQREDAIRITYIDTSLIINSLGNFVNIPKGSQQVVGVVKDFYFSKQDGCERDSFDLTRNFSLDTSGSSELTSTWFSQQLWIARGTTFATEYSLAGVVTQSRSWDQSYLYTANGVILADTSGMYNVSGFTNTSSNSYNQFSFKPTDTDFTPWNDSVDRAIARVPTSSFYLGTGNLDKITGTTASEVFIPLGGDDVITMGGGKDLLVLASTSANPMVKDFSVAEDKIFLSNKTFTSLSQVPGALDSQNFVNGTIRQDSNDYIFYNQGTGGLFYDADGNGSGAAIQIATLGSSIHPSLTATSFIVG